MIFNGLDPFLAEPGMGWGGLVAVGGILEIIAGPGFAVELAANGFPF